VPDPPLDPNAVHSRVLTHADRLFEALEDLGAAGGLAALASRLKPASVERTAKVLRSARAAIDAQLAGLKATRGGRP
jgi:hypothetical protein